MPRLSIIVPHQGETGLFEDTLASVLQNRPADCEVLAPHAASYRDPYDLGDEVTFLPLAGQPGLLKLLNAAVSYADGDVLHVVQNGIEVVEGWADAALAYFDEPEVGSVAGCLLDARKTDRLIGCGVTLTTGGRRRLVGRGQRVAAAVGRQDAAVLGPALPIAFYRTTALQSLGGFDVGLSESLADVDVALSLLAAGYECCVATDCMAVSSVAFADGGLSFEEGRDARLLQRRHLATDVLQASLVGQSLGTLNECLSGMTRPAALAAYLRGRMSGSFAPLKQSDYERRLQAVIESGHNDEASMARQVLPITHERWQHDDHDHGDDRIARAA
ncbi:MAG: glycosyltransferase family 2 protein [Planctomycetales bacterium]|nr:glycosyltransferase family 2 protein [Planctomycetales bacterium]